MKFSRIHSLSIPLWTFLRSFLVSAFRLEALVQGRIQDFEIGGAWSENIA
jgi:hypothetical protein